MLLVKPGGTARASFSLTTTEGAPAVGERLEFSAVDDPRSSSNEVRGATLAAASGLTDDAGIGTVTVTGGLPTIFRLLARNPRAGTAEMLVSVSEGDQGTIAVVPISTGGSTAAMAVTTVDVLLFDSLSCSELPVSERLMPVRPIKSVAPGAAAQFSVSDMTSSAVIGQGRDAAGRLWTVGCVDVPGSSIIPGNVVQLYLPLSDFQPELPRTFVLTSKISLAKRAITQRLAAPWQDLADCPLDPGQLWLDCAVDALGTAADDPLDCVPAPTGEGELAALITSHRGMTVAGSACRASTIEGGGQPGLEAKIAALFPSPAQPPANGIARLGRALSTILDDVTLGSQLSLAPTASSGLFQATHALQSATFLVSGASTVVDIVAQGGLAPQARLISVTERGATLSLDTHRLGLQLGTLAHVAFSKSALVRPGWPAETAAFLDALFGLASSGTGADLETGCDALDGLICSEVGREVGCLRSACLAGQAALATKLDAAFALVDGDGADLQLSGSAGMTDDNGDGRIDRLGVMPDQSGLWTAQIRAHAGTEILSGSWTGTAVAP